jgi:hypothetical protein
MRELVSLIIRVRQYGGTYIARAGKAQTSCTFSAEYAVQRTALKWFGLLGKVTWDQSGIDLRRLGNDYIWEARREMPHECHHQVD